MTTTQTNKRTAFGKRRQNFEQQWINLPIRNRSTTGKERKNIELELLTQAIAHACYSQGQTICVAILSDYPVPYINWVTRWVTDAQRTTARLRKTHRPGLSDPTQVSAYCEHCNKPAHLNSRNMFYCCYCRHETQNTGQSD